ncbi:Arm DNA-binding domain-containing protein [Empedobacter brevis]|uniref:Arm DNA-binding domain-containing protein n=1 Tax=Empedobacter brevis TaxID=247 RepID=UPI0035E3E75A
MKISLVFDRRKRRNKNGLIQICCYLDGKWIYFSTGVHVKSDEWDEKYSFVNDIYYNIHLC